jgi:RNA polymerase sigma factor (sigma-70 family)
MRRQALLRYRAERALRADFAILRPRVTSIVRGRLRAHGVELDAIDLDACYAQAWHGLYATELRGEQVQDRSAWLVLVTYRRAIDEIRARARQIAHAEPLEREPAAVELMASGAAASDAAVRLDDRARLRQLFEALRATLTARERRAVSLCYLQGLSRAEAAAHMGISENRMRKLMDGSHGRPGVAHKFGELLRAIHAGRWCEQQSSLIRAYAFGLLDTEGERHRLAAAHLRECPSCRAFVACLRGLAAVLPPLPPPLQLPPAARPRAPKAARPRATSRATSRATAGTGKALAAKLAVIGTIALGGASYALFAGSAPGHTAPGRSLGHVPRPALPAAKASLPVRPVPAPPRHRRRHGARRTPAGASPAPLPAVQPRIYAPPAPAYVPPSPASHGSSSVSSPVGEFSPERTARR